jgi:hypothetical protein
MRKGFLFLMVLAGALVALPGCTGTLGAMLPTLLIDGGMSVLTSLLGALWNGLTAPAA